MNLQPLKNGMSRRTLYASVMLLTAVIGMLAQVIVVPPAWKWWPYTEVKEQPTLNQRNVCGTWVSATSRKRYDFVCLGQGSFEIYEVSDQGLSKNGSGKLIEDNVEAELLSMPKSRRAHLRLKLSADGLRMEGSWQGDDPRESGQLMFHRA